MDRDFNAEVGARIRALRAEKKMTREALTEEADISVQFLSDIEFGKKGMSALTLKKICRALSVSADYIIFGQNNSRNTCEIQELLEGLDSVQLKAVEEILEIIIKNF